MAGGAQRQWLQSSLPDGQPLVREFQRDVVEVSSRAYLVAFLEFPRTPSEREVQLGLLLDAINEAFKLQPGDFMQPAM